MINAAMTDPLVEFARTGTPDAFGVLVKSHVDAVYSQSLRQLRDPAAADDVTQQVFITLARKGRTLPANTVLSGWLFVTTRFCCGNFQRAAIRRQNAERKAAIMRQEAIDTATVDGDFRAQADPILDDAIAELKQPDRDALLLRFFQGLSLHDVGQQLGVSEDAAKQRVARAVEKLRKYFSRRGVTAPGTAMTALLESSIHPAAAHVTQAALLAAAHSAAGAPAGAALAAKATAALLTAGKAAAMIIAAGALTAAVIVASKAADAPATLPALPTVANGPAAPDVPPAFQDRPLDTLIKLSTAIEVNDTSAIDDCLCSDNRNPDTADLGRAWIEGQAAIYRVEKAWRGKFGAAMSEPSFGFDDFVQETFHDALRNMLSAPGGPPATVDGDVALVSIPTPPDFFAGTGPYRLPDLQRWSGAKLVFNRIDGNWRLNTDRSFNFELYAGWITNPHDDIVAASAKGQFGVNRALDDVAARIEDGSLDTRAKAIKAGQTEVMRAVADAGMNRSRMRILPVIGGEPPAPQPTPGPLPAKSPIQALSALADAMAADDAAEIDRHVCDDRGDTAALGRAMIRGEASVFRLDNVWRKKFASAVDVNGLNFHNYACGTLVTVIQRTVAQAHADDVTIDGDLAYVRIPLPPEDFGGSGTERNVSLERWSGASLVMRRVKDQWALDVDRTFNFQLGLGRMDGNGDDCIKVACKIGDGLITMLEDAATNIDTGVLPSAKAAAVFVQTRTHQAYSRAGVSGFTFELLPVLGG
jgi:RNA polymerase sigma factor (sigma-70 family)